MEFDWDAANVAHIARHGITPEECEEADWNGPMVIEVQERKRERHRLCLGETNAARLLTFVIKERKDKIRLSRTRCMKQREICRKVVPIKPGSDIPSERKKPSGGTRWKSLQRVLKAKKEGRLSGCP
jgi:uncharacterized DUF497 family protein